jgi:hypothetical protein
VTPVVVLVLVAGASEAVGRLLPVVARRPGTSPRLVVGLLLTGTLVEAAVIALWPLVASALAERAGGTGDVELVWTPGLIAPLVLTAVLAFPLLGPLLHLLLLVGVGAGLTDALVARPGLDLPTAAACVAAAAVGLALGVEVVRRVVIVLITPSRAEAVA